MAGEFIPTIWSKLILESLKKILVAMQITNQDWEGDISEYGDTVRIFTPGPVTSKPYTPDVDIAAPETPTDIETNLVIDQMDYFNFKINDILNRQSAAQRTGSYIDEATYALRDTIDQFLLSFYTDVATENITNPVGSGVLVTTSNIYTLFSEMYRRLTDSKNPTEGRYAVVSPVIMEVIQGYFAGRQTDFGDNASMDGSVGKFAGFDIFLSHNVPVVVESLTGTGDQNVNKCLIGRKIGLTFAAQIPAGSLERYRPEKRFEDAIKGLSLYGAKMLRSGASNGLINLAVD